MNKVAKYILISISSLAIATFLVAMIFYIYLLNAIYTSFGVKKEIVIGRGKGIIEIAQIMKEEKIIKSKWPFVIYALGQTDGRKLQAGKYIIEPNDSIATLVKKLARGDVISNEAVITFPEGITKKEIENILKTNGLLTFSDSLESGLEGYLFPDTYKFFKDSSKEDLIAKFRENFDKKAGFSLKYDALIMASLIEKEVKTKEDKEIVSGILWKRLKVDMPLQVDATITYITGKKDTKVSIQETKIDSPYNTYLYRGLPPGPISNPGLESINAALYPKESGFWYYLSAKDGQTVFSKTLQEHTANKHKYLNF